MRHGAVDRLELRWFMEAHFVIGCRRSVKLGLAVSNGLRSGQTVARPDALRSGSSGPSAHALVNVYVEDVLAKCAIDSCVGTLESRRCLSLVSRNCIVIAQVYGVYQ
jgi:hypothetical protein